jgi:hypothetical protein
MFAFIINDSVLSLQFDILAHYNSLQELKNTLKYTNTLCWKTVFYKNRDCCGSK